MVEIKNKIKASVRDSEKMDTAPLHQLGGRQIFSNIPGHQLRMGIGA